MKDVRTAALSIANKLFTHYIWLMRTNAFTSGLLVCLQFFQTLGLVEIQINFTFPFLTLKEKKYILFNCYFPPEF